ncbi:hypothetical protein KC345_g9503 [Hortaea werneckii]|nr:hypothetical protein KC345_g9503 [Hortaea werneckii]
MAIIEVVKYDGPAGVFAWKYPNQELGTWTQLIVNESQEAILFKGGQALDSFTAGRHTLSTANIPILSSVVNLPFGGKSPFTAEVWFVNKMNSMNVKWGTSAPLQLQDPKYKIMVGVRAFGQFGVRVDDPRKFLLKLVGTLPLFDQETMVNYFRGLLMSNINELISSYLVHKKISILEINAYVVEISKHIQGRLASSFVDNGIELNNFFIDSINIPDDDPATVRLKEALAKKAEMDIIGFTYQQERSFNTMEEAAGNPGNIGAGMMNTGLGLGMGFGLAGPAAEIVTRMTRTAVPLIRQMRASVQAADRAFSLYRLKARFAAAAASRILWLRSAPEAVRTSPVLLSGAWIIAVYVISVLASAVLLDWLLELHPLWYAGEQLIVLIVAAVVLAATGLYGWNAASGERRDADASRNLRHHRQELRGIREIASTWKQPGSARLIELVDTLEEKFRYSDPISNPELSATEDMINQQISLLHDHVALLLVLKEPPADWETETQELTESIAGTLQRRNRELAALK